ncbi:MAG TPA: TonB-dependent receptor [Prolixibacteraceae bacterium]|nr:TonB-dependent receptor [Prolixibacteraceae bacterium]
MEKKLFKKKTALIMRMTLLFILFGFLQVTAKVHPGTNGSPELLTANAGIKVTGTVTSKTDGQAIPGANVVLKGTTVGMITSSNGTFSIEVPNANSVLVFSFVGFIPQEIKLDGKTQLNVVLEEENLNVEQVVVVGYGSVKKKDLTGSVSSVSNAKLMEKASFSAAQALQGKAAGVVVQQKSSAPGSDATVMIRGNRSLKASNEPLYVVDGMPLVIGLSEISQSDIETIDILKDASATAIYGARGANGVVLITTKKGKEGKAVVDYNSYYGVQTPSKSVDLFNGPEWVEFIREAYRKAGKLPAVPTYDTDKLMMPVGQENDPAGIGFKIQNAYDADGSWHPERLQSTDWLGEVMRTGTITNHEVSIRGGTEKLKVMASATYFNQKGLIKTQDYSRYSARVNFDWNLTDKVTIGGQTQFSHFDRSDGPNVYDGIKSLSPLANIRNEDGVLFNRPGNDPQLWNPILNITQATVKYRKDRFMGSYYLEVKLPFDMKYRSNFGLDVGPYYDQRFYGSLSSDRQGGLARAENGSDTRTMYTWENLLFWNKTIKKHTFGVTALQSIQQEKYEVSRISVTNLPFESQLWYNVGSSPTAAGVSSKYTKWQLASFMGRLNYSFNDRYLLTASIRNDGSSRLAEGHQWVLFPAAAVAWRASEESFLKGIDVLSNLKFRAGYGVTATTAIDPYKTGGNLDYARYNFGSTNVMAFYQSEMPNPNLGWETTKSWNAGVDFGLFDGRINGVVDVYLQNTSDLLMDRQLPQTSGFTSVVSNIGKTRNKGIEITINTQNIKKKDFSWSTDFIFGRNKEEIVELYGGTKDDVGNSWFIGQPLTVFFDYKSLGIWQLGEEAEMAKFTSNSFKPGDIKVQDTNGDYKITDVDRVIIGTPRPTFTGNIANYINYKDFDFNFSLNGSYGNMLNYDRNMSFNGRYNSIKVNYWKATAYDASGNITASNGSNEAPRPNNGIENPGYRNSLNYFEASFLRLSDVTLGYTLPKNLIKKVGITKLRMYVTVQNGFCWTKFPGTDPESGTDFNVPTPRTFMFGINMSL